MDILDSLPGLFSEADGGLAEAVRRDAELDENPAMGLSLSEFDQKKSELARTVNVVFHPRVFAEVDAIMRYYEEVADCRLADDFYE